jgi:hypothetical protein
VFIAYYFALRKSQNSTDQYYAQARRIEEILGEKSVPQKTFVNFKKALLRLAKDLGRNKKNERCGFRDYCQTTTSP